MIGIGKIDADCGMPQPDLAGTGRWYVPLLPLHDFGRTCFMNNLRLCHFRPLPDPRAEHPARRCVLVHRMMRLQSVVIACA
jgi:hypothetical protein